MRHLHQNLLFLKLLMVFRPSNKRRASLALGAAFVLAAGLFLVLPYAFATTYTSPAAVIEATTTPPSKPVSSSAGMHVATPASVKAIYMSQCVAGTPSFRDSLSKLIETTDLNAVVIDIKDFSGGIAFPTDNPLLSPYVSKQCGARDMKAFIAGLHAKGIYVIGRISVFQDAAYAKQHPNQAVQDRRGGVWKNHGGLPFVDVSAKPFWDYIVELSRVAYEEQGFDELNYDYIRYPSDGPVKEAVYQNANKPEALERFFQYLSAQVKPTGAVISADLFGYVTVHTDDLGIGQVLERALPYFDYIDPMVYPSHYNAGFAGLKNVNSDPYKVVQVSLVEAVARTLATSTVVETFAGTPIMETVTVPATATVATTTAQKFSGRYTKDVYPASKIRPWLQAFDYPVPYTSAMVQAQIKATNDAGLTAYLMWDASNKYTALRRALTTEVTGGSGQ